MAEARATNRLFQLEREQEALLQLEREKEATNKKKRTRTRRTSESSESSESSTPPPAKRLSKTLGVKRPVRGGRGRGKN